MSTPNSATTKSFAPTPKSCPSRRHSPERETTTGRSKSNCHVVLHRRCRISGTAARLAVRARSADLLHRGSDAFGVTRANLAPGCAGNRDCLLCRTRSALLLGRNRVAETSTVGLVRELCARGFLVRARYWPVCAHASSSARRTARARSAALQPAGLDGWLSQ